MFNTVYNSIYNQTPAPFVVGIPDWSFNGYSLKTPNITLQSINVEDAGDIEYNDFLIPRDHGNGYLSRYFRAKTITMSGSLNASTYVLLNELIDEFKSNISEATGILKYVVNGTHRQIECTAIDINIPREHFHITFVPFEVTFRSTEAFFHDSSNISLLQSGETGSPITIEITNEGSAESKPQIFLSFNSASSVTTVSVALNNRTVTFNGSISASDSLVLDSLNKEVTLNTVDQDYDGTFPILNKNVNTIEITIDGTFNVDVAVLYRKNYV